MNKYHDDSECMEVRAVDYEYITEAIQSGSLDSRDEFYEQRGVPVEELEEVQFSPGRLLESESSYVSLSRLNKLNL